MTPRSRKPVMVLNANLNSNDQHQTIPNNEVAENNETNKDLSASNSLKEADQIKTETDINTKNDDKEKSTELSVMEEEFSDNTYGLSSDFK